MSESSVLEALRLSGIVTTAGLLAGGMSERQIRTLASRGDLVPVARGVYAAGARAGKLLGHDKGDRVLRTMAALAVIGSGAVISHQSAAQHYGIDLLGKPVPDVTLTCRPERGWKDRNGIHLYAVQLPANHVTIHNGLPTTTPARTVVDLARLLEVRAGVVAADSALRHRLTTKPELRSVLACCRRWRGVRRAAAVVEFADERAESALESIGRVVLRDCGLPVPELQVWLGGTEEPVARVDFYWRKYRTVAEADGAIKYSDPARAKLQLRRDALLRAEGFEIVHFDWYEITKTPQQVAAAIRVAFERGERTAAARARRLTR
jgi:predicted transcriptional regulator of viral defense system